MGKHRREEKRREKERVKARETPAERRERRLAKKERKRKREAELSKSIYGGYTNEMNPFGDAQLTNKFVWKKRGDTGKGKRMSRDKQLENRRELERVKRRREERDRERAEWEEEKARLQREREANEYGDWEAEEERFHSKQARQRAEIRIKEGRGKALDTLAQNLVLRDRHDARVRGDMPADEVEAQREHDAPLVWELDVERAPRDVVRALSTQELEEARTEIESHRQLGEHRAFWDALRLVCDDELVKRRGAAHGVASGEGVHAALSADVRAVFEGKSAPELDELERAIAAKLGSGEALDVEYWETMRKQLGLFRAEAVLAEWHEQLIESRMAQLEELAEHMPDRAIPTLGGVGDGDDVDGVVGGDGGVEDSEGEEAEADEHASGQAYAESRQRQLEERAMHARAEQKQTIAAMVQRARSTMDRQEDAGEMEEMKPGVIQVAVDDDKVYRWEEKYRPRKPQFYNRVKTGFDWNKYNQTHYDTDNPPPKVVQGYKFNVFYPDLIDPTKAPTYHVLPGDEPGTCILRFHAGAPYEDIAFRIVDKEWEYSHRRGYKCVFDRGVLLLWFNFKRLRYRR